MTARAQYWEEDWPGSLAAKYVKGLRLPIRQGGWKHLIKASKQRRLWRSIACQRDDRTNRILWEEMKGKLEPLGIIRRISADQVKEEDHTWNPSKIPRVFINLRLVEKEGHEPRPCLAACSLNNAVQPKKFKQAGSRVIQSTMQKGDSCQNVDVKKAFNHMFWQEEWVKIGSFFLVDPDTGEIQMFEYPASWFGQMRAPEFLDTAFKPIEHSLHMVGCRVVRVVDDFLLMDQCPVANCRHLKFLLLMSIRYGIGYGPDKARIGFQQQEMDFAGWRWDMKNLMFYPRQRSIDRLVTCAQEQLALHAQGKTVSVRTGPARLVGLIRSTRDANRYAMLNTRALLQCYILTVQRDGWDSLLHRYDEESVRELNYWALIPASEWSGSTAHAEMPDYVLDPDSSGTGGGFHLHEGPHNPEVIQRWFYPRADLRLHNNLLETRNSVDSLLAVVTELERLNIPVEHKMFLIRPDNTTAVCALDKIKSRSLACLHQALRLVNFAALKHLSVRAIHFPGEESLIADGESRAYATMADLCMNEWLFDVINSRWGAFTFSLFDANYLCHGLPYGAWKVDPYSTWRDSMIHDWREAPQPANYYAFPPFHMLNRVLERVRLFDIDMICIVAPVWPGRIWWPTMMDMLVDWPLIVPFDENHFFLPGKRLSLRSSQRWWTRDWSMGIFPISAKLSKRKAFRHLLSTTLSTDGPRELRARMAVLGENGSPTASSLAKRATQRVLTTLQLRIT
jgi:hypothetical protein